MAGERYYTEVLEEYVRPSAALLDIENVDWHKGIDEFRLNMASLSDCMLGQLYGSYWIGRQVLALDEDTAVRRGFCPKGMKLTASVLGSRIFLRGYSTVHRPIVRMSDHETPPLSWRRQNMSASCLQ